MVFNVEMQALCGRHRRGNARGFVFTSQQHKCCGSSPSFCSAGEIRCEEKGGIRRHVLNYLESFYSFDFDNINAGKTGRNVESK